MKIKKVLVYAAAMLSMAVCTYTYASSYKFSELTPISGSNFSYAHRINNLEQVVGYTQIPSEIFNTGASYRPTIWNNNVPTQLNSLGENGYALDINDAGTVVGYTSPTYTTHDSAVVWKSGAITYIGGSDSARTIAINNNGQVLRVSSPYSSEIWRERSSPYSQLPLYQSNGVYLGLRESYAINDLGQVAGRVSDDVVAVSDGATVNTLSSFGGGYSKPEAINNDGQVVGTSLTASRFYHATLWSGSSVVDLGTLDDQSYSSGALGINTSGQVVGYSYTSAGSRAFIWDGSKMLDLNSFLDGNDVNAGWVLNSASDINDKGSIIGMAYNSQLGVSRNFLLQAIPEPETYMMLILGLGFMGVATRRTTYGAMH
jgi:probable HAF family extracellular repeat protein